MPRAAPFVVCFKKTIPGVGELSRKINLNHLPIELLEIHQETKTYPLPYPLADIPDRSPAYPPADTVADTVSASGYGPCPLADTVADTVADTTSQAA